jgi:endogenous inhibitor of DNA gyrase (YacG/DUF329 family)
MKVNWKDEKENIEKLIKEGVPYERIGRQYDVSGTAVKKAAKKLGIELEQKREINPNEHFNKGKITYTIHTCLNCGKEFEHKKGDYFNKFCSNKCQGEYKKKSLIESWKKGEYKGSAEYLSNTIKNYLLEKNNYKCEICGFEGYNTFTKNSILQIHHKDGDSSNNSEENLQVLCPNCHAMTETYGNCGKRKSSRTRYDSKTYYFDKFKNEYGIK